MGGDPLLCELSMPGLLSRQSDFITMVALLLEYRIRLDKAAARDNPASEDDNAE